MKYLIIRNDDIGYFSNVKFLSWQQEELNCFPQTYGIIPFTVWENRSFIASENYELVEFFNTHRIYKAIHGIRHDDILGKYEFLGLHNKEYIVDGLEAIKNNSFFSTQVFIPPHNYMSDDWNDLLKKYGFKIFSKTKRTILSYYNDKVEFDENSSVPCGVIKKNGYYLIPQSFMIRKKTYYKYEYYFLHLLNLIEEYYKKIDLLVITIHWWDFMEKGVLDKEFFGAFKSFTKTLYKNGVKGVSFESAAKIPTQSFISNDFFYIERK